MSNSQREPMIPAPMSGEQILEAIEEIEAALIELQRFLAEPPSA